jgi:hypothetical protein
VSRVEEVSRVQKASRDLEVSSESTSQLYLCEERALGQYNVPSVVVDQIQLLLDSGQYMCDRVCALAPVPTPLAA